ncbi:putative dehydrogenase [Parelusimicrobium proximum]|uniref:Gfo/Idh/MocA family protein n=1 Tax=Parelusimicrobium proximum TaxID=3228953 RepID=UPI003D1737A0
MKKFRAAVAGVGFVGVAHVEALRRLGNIDVVAVCDNTDIGKKAKELFVPAAYKDYKEMIDKENLDMLHICTPNNLHYDMAMYAMSRGVNILCEKPLTTTAAEAQAMLDYAQKHNILHAVNFHNRFNPMTHQLKHMIAEDLFGRVVSVHGGYLQDWLLYETDFSWRINKSESGNTRAIADIGSHWLDTVEYITGLKVKEVLADFSTIHPVRKKSLKPIETFSSAKLKHQEYEDVPIDTEDFATLLIRFDNGAKGTAILSQVFAGKKNKISVFIGGSKQSAEWDMENSINEVKIGRRDDYNQILHKSPDILHPKTRAIVSYPGGHVEGFPDTFKQGFKQVYACLEDKKCEIRDFATFKDGLRQMQLAEKIYESAHSDRWVSTL